MTAGFAAYRAFMLTAPPSVPDVEKAIAHTWQAMGVKGRARWEAVAQAAAKATPVTARFSLARCGDHPGEVHAQVLDEAAAGLPVWVCLRALAGIAEGEASAVTLEAHGG